MLSSPFLIKSSYVLNYSFLIKYDIILLTFKKNIHTIGTKFDIHIKNIVV